MTPGQVLLLIIWFGLALFVGAEIGHRKGRPWLGWGLALLLGWLGVIILAFIPATHEKQVEREAARMRIQDEARRRADGN